MKKLLLLLLLPVIVWAGLSDSLVHYWELSTVSDSIGALDLTLNGNADLDSAGINGNCLFSDDASSYTNIGTYNFNAYNFSFLFWMKSTNDAIASFFEIGYPYPSFYGSDDGAYVDYVFRTRTNTGGLLYLRAENILRTSLKDGNWHMFACTFDSGIVAIYLDGSLYNSDSTRTSDYLSYTGDDYDLYTQFDDGYIDEAMIYNRTLSEAEIDSLWNSGDGLFYPFTTETVDSIVAGFTVDTTWGYDTLDVTFTDTSTGTPTSWKWLFGDGDSSTTQSPTHQYDSTGYFDVTLISTNATNSDTITVDSLIHVLTSDTLITANFGQDTTSGLMTLSVQFSDSSISADSIISWVWDFGTGDTSHSQNPSYDYDTLGYFDVSLIATNSYVSDTMLVDSLIYVYSNIDSVITSPIESGNIFDKLINKIYSILGINVGN